MNTKQPDNSITSIGTEVYAGAEVSAGAPGRPQAEAISRPQPEALLNWYDANRRSLPWRDEPTPYHVWVSEIMLQQTRVEAVREYYQRFLSVLPDIDALAKADEDTYLKLWEGLGYYSRVRNLHKAAVQIVTEHGGRMPESSRSLQKLAGIGPYTSAAIASICFGERIPAVDGNLLRVFARLTGYREDIKTPAAKNAATDFYLELFPQERCGDMNQALMDLGATICLPKGRPFCEQCPWQEHCFARQTDQQEQLPVTAEKKERPVEHRTVFLIYYDQKLALQKRPDQGLLAGLYEFPNADGRLSRKQAADYVAALGFGPVRLQKLPEAKHIFSHREWHMTGWQVLADEWKEFSSGSPREHELFLATAEELENVYSIPSAFAKYRKEIRQDFL